MVLGVRSAESVIDRRMRVHIGSPETNANMWDVASDRPTVFSRELQQFLDTGYTRDGNNLIPPAG